MSNVTYVVGMADGVYDCIYKDKVLSSYRTNIMFITLHFPPAFLEFLSSSLVHISSILIQKNKKTL